MADQYEISDAFVANVLEDNKRLREDNANLLKALKEAQQQLREAKRLHASEIFRMVRAAGGTLSVPPHDGNVNEPLRLFVDRIFGPYGDGANYRLAPENEVLPPTFGGEVVDEAA